MCMYSTACAYVQYLLWQPASITFSLAKRELRNSWRSDKRQVKDTNDINESYRKVMFPKQIECFCHSVSLTLYLSVSLFLVQLISILCTICYSFASICVFRYISSDKINSVFVCVPRAFSAIVRYPSSMQNRLRTTIDKEQRKNKTQTQRNN